MYQLGNPAPQVCNHLLAVPDVTRRRVLVIVADGLRPDSVDEDVMPTVTRLARQGVRFGDHHAVYPSHTRVNASSLATGVSPGRHGIVANTMLVPFATDDHIIDTSDYQHLDALDRYTGGNALLVPTLGELLERAGKRLAVAGTGSGGSNLLWTRHDRGRIVNLNATYGLADLYDLREKLGPVPPIADGPQLERMRYATRAVTELFVDDEENQVVVLWLSEPDGSQHRFGLGAPETLAALRGVDDCVATLLDALDRRGIRDQFDLLFLSDHGHSTVMAHRTLGDYLRLARTDLNGHMPALVTASDYIYAAPGTAPPSAKALAPLVSWLIEQPWTGLVLGGSDEIAELPGVLPLHRLWNGVASERQPLLAVSPRWDGLRNAFGVPGAVMALTTQAALRSSHGSASPYDMHAVLVASGPRFREAVESSLPTGAIDVLPTLLKLLGLPLPDHLEGRVLYEALREPEGEPGDYVVEVLEPVVRPADATSRRLTLKHVGRTTYVHGAVHPEATFPPRVTGAGSARQAAAVAAHPGR